MTKTYLAQVEIYNGTAYTTQAEMTLRQAQGIAYNGLGQRQSMDASGVIAYYVMDGNRPLTAESNGNTTSYLYGLGVIGEENNTWSYSLTDGTNTQRQLTDSTGEVTYSARYTPWGDTLDSSGTGNFTFGYFGGLMDEATGLLYVGEGQYYDPSTRRFLARNPNASGNPYLPIDPTGALFVPLAFASLLYGKKKKKSKLDVLIIIALLSLSAGAGVAACGEGGFSAEITPTSTPMPGYDYIVTTESGTATGFVPFPSATPTPSPYPCPEIPTAIPSTPTPNDILQIPYPGSPAYDKNNAWSKTIQKYKDLRDWMLINAPDDLVYSSDSDGYGNRFKDEVLLSIIISVEFVTLRYNNYIFDASLGALSNQYVSSIFCNGNCDSVRKQLIWLSNKQGIRHETVNWIGQWYPQMNDYGRAVKNGDYSNREGWEWGNFEKNSAFDKHPENYPNVAYIKQPDGIYAGFVVFTSEQDINCGSCLGWK